MLDLKQLFLFKNQKYIVIDTETEHLNLVLGKNRPWQISWLVCQGKEIKKEYDYYTKINNLKLSEGAAIVTHFNQYDYNSKAVSPQIVFDDLDSFISNPEYYIIWQNGLNFDINILRTFYSICGKELEFNKILPRTIDTSLLSRALLDDIKFPINLDSNFDLLVWQYKLKNHLKKGLKTNTKKMCEVLDIPYSENAHNALYDDRMCQQIFIKLLEKLS